MKKDRRREGKREGGRKERKKGGRKEKKGGEVNRCVRGKSKGIVSG